MVNSIVNGNTHCRDRQPPLTTVGVRAVGDWVARLAASFSACFLLRLLGILVLRRGIAVNSQVGAKAIPKQTKSSGTFRQLCTLLYYNEAREARSLFFLGFPRKKKPLQNGSCEACRVPFFFFLCMFLCIRQHRNRPLRSTAFNAHGTNASPDGLCARTNNNEAFSCWSCCKSFRVGRARRGNVCF